MMPRRIIQIILILSGILLFSWVLSSPFFRDAEGFLKGDFCLPFAVSVSLFILGLSVYTHWKKAGAWMALALMGQAVALQLINAGKMIHYQHYLTPGDLFTGVSRYLLVFIFLQTVIVLFGFREIWFDVKRWLRSHFKNWQLIAIFIVFSVSSATLSRHVPDYTAEILTATYIQIIALLNFILVVHAISAEVRSSLKVKIEKWFRSESGNESTTAKGLDYFVIFLALWVVFCAALINVVSYEKHPHIPDEVAYIYQAKYFSGGMISMPAPPVPEAFDLDLMYYEPHRWFSIFPFGWPLFLTFGLMSGIPWMENPLLAGLNIILAFFFFRRIYDDSTARISIFLLAASPWYIFMAMSFMSHMISLTFALIAAITGANLRNTRKLRWAILSGISIGIVSWVRPLEGMAIAVLIGFWMLTVRGRRFRFSPVIVLAIAALLTGAVTLPYNKDLTGQPLNAPVMAYFDKYYGPKTNALGFGPERGIGWGLDPYPGHSPLDALVNINLNTTSIDDELFGWGTGSLLLIFLLLFSGKMKRSDYYMWAVILVIAGLQSLYWFSGGPDFGARYWFLVIIPCVALSARGIQFLSSPAKSAMRPAIILGILALSFISLVNFFPWRAIDKYHHYRGMRADIRELSNKYKFGKSLVLVRGERFPDYMSAAAYNPVNLQANQPIYVWDRSSEVRERVLDAYPDRPVWIVNGPSLTEKGYSIASGPLTVDQMLSNSD